MRQTLRNQPIDAERDTAEPRLGSMMLAIGRPILSICIAILRHFQVKYDFNFVRPEAAKKTMKTIDPLTLFAMPDRPRRWAEVVLLAVIYFLSLIHI